MIIVIIVIAIVIVLLMKTRNGSGSASQRVPTGGGVKVYKNIDEMEDMRADAFQRADDLADETDSRVVPYIKRWRDLMDAKWLQSAELRESSKAVYIGKLSAVAKEKDGIGILKFHSGEIHLGWWRNDQLDGGEIVILFADGRIKVASYEKGVELTNNRKFIFYPDGRREVK